MTFKRECSICNKVQNKFLVTPYKLKDGKFICDICVRKYEVPKFRLKSRSYDEVLGIVTEVIKRRNSNQNLQRFENLVNILRSSDAIISKTNNINTALSRIETISNTFDDLFSLANTSTLDTTPPLNDLYNKYLEDQHTAICLVIERYFQERLFLDLYDLSTIKTREARLLKESQKHTLIIRENKLILNKDPIYEKINEMYLLLMTKVDEFGPKEKH